MSESREAIQARLQAAIPGFGASQGSQTLNTLASRNNISRAAIEVYAEAAKRAEFQQREFAKIEAQRLKEQQELEQFQANVQREATAQYEAALASVGDERTQSVLAQNGTLSNQVRTNLNAQLQNLRASGKHVDKQGNLTFQAASLQAALGEADRISTQDLNSRFGGDETARSVATQQAERNLNAGPLENFASGAVASFGRNLVGLPAQLTSAVAGDTALGRGAGRLAAAAARAADARDIVTPEEQAFRDEFAASEGFSGGLATILQNPGQALQSFGPDVAGGLGAGTAVRAGGTAALRQIAPEALERAGQNRARRQAGRVDQNFAEAPDINAGGRLGRAANNFENAATAAAPAVFAAGGGEFAQGAQGAIDSETDDIGSFARRGLAVSGLETLATGGVGAAGGATLDAPLFRARQALQQPLPEASGALGRVGRFGRTVGGEIGRGAAGEGIVEGLAGGAQNISQQIGEGTSLAELDGSRVIQAAGQGAAAGFALGGAVSGATGTGTTLRRRAAEDDLRSQLNLATGVGTESGVQRERPGLARLNSDTIDTTVGALQQATPEEQVGFVNQVAADLGIQSTTISPQAVSTLFDRATVGDTIDSGLFRQAVGELLGVNLTVGEDGVATRGADTTTQPEATPPPANIVQPEPAVEDQLDLLQDAGDADVTNVELNTEPEAGESADGGTIPDLSLDGELDLSSGDAPVLDPVDTDVTVDKVTDGDTETSADPAASEPDTSGILDSDIEASFGDIPSVQRLRAANDGSPEAQAREDFELNLIREQTRAGLRDSNSLFGAGQVEIDRRLNEAADQAGISDPDLRRLFQDQNRDAIADGFRQERAAAVAANASRFQPIETAVETESTGVDVGTDANNFVRDSSELNLITNDADPQTGIIPAPLRTALLGSYSKQAERRALKDVPESERPAIREQYIQPDDLKNPSDLAAVNQILNRVRVNLGQTYRFRAEELHSGTGQVQLKRKGTEAGRAAAVQKLRETIPEELAKVQDLMTPDGYQRVFGKKR